jgi:hypothetical protein
MSVFFAVRINDTFEFKIMFKIFLVFRCMLFSSFFCLIEWCVAKDEFAEYIIHYYRFFLFSINAFYIYFRMFPPPPPQFLFSNVKYVLKMWTPRSTHFVLSSHWIKIWLFQFVGTETITSHHGLKMDLTKVAIQLAQWGLGHIHLDRAVK